MKYSQLVKLKLILMIIVLFGNKITKFYNFNTLSNKLIVLYIIVFPIKIKFKT